MLYIWPVMGKLVTLLAVVLALVASAHAILRRRDSRAAVAWVLALWIFPFVGSLLYYLFGINRIERRATRLRRRVRARLGPPPEPKEAVRKHIPAPQLRALARLVDGAVQWPLNRGNAIRPLINGEEAYPAMLKAIDSAKTSIALSSYIFNHDQTGLQFIEALVRAAQRGVQVRVLIDDVGAGFFWPGVYRKLSAHHVPVAYFLPTLIPWRMTYFNMRNHRKILVVDGRTGFTGGMNIHEGHLTSLTPRPRNLTEDLHFEIKGPVVAQMQEAFRIDWCFATDEWLEGPAWFPLLKPAGPALARGIPSGPDEDFEKCRWTILGALAHAQEHVRISTPYLILDAGVMTAVNLAAMSGVTVDIILSDDVDLALIKWASRAMLWQVLERGVRVWRTPPPFNHSKVMTIDGGWTLVGSSNWDPRSLRLNFEFDVECYDAGLAQKMERLLDARIAKARRITLQEMDSRPLPVRFRDGVARLASPFL